MPTVTICATPGPLGGATRAALPARAFALPARRKYPIYKRVGGRLVPGSSPARAALARAAQWSGRLTARELATITRRADAVLAQCEGGPSMATKKKATKTKASGTTTPRSLDRLIKAGRLHMNGAEIFGEWGWIIEDTRARPTIQRGVRAR